MVTERIDKELVARIGAILLAVVVLLGILPGSTTTPVDSDGVGSWVGGDTGTGVSSSSAPVVGPIVQNRFLDSIPDMAAQPAVAARTRWVAPVTRPVLETAPKRPPPVDSAEPV